MTLNPEGWPEGWPDIPRQWQPEPGWNPHIISVMAVGEVTMPDGSFPAPILQIMFNPGEPGYWHWTNGGHDHMVEGPPVVDDSLSQFQWQYSDGQVAVRIRAYDPVSDEPMQRL